ncbi:MAG TPA: DUF4331 family protein [Polyangium sp.]|nr:DUF4331 family protein [Polyangium sp.]
MKLQTIALATIASMFFVAVGCSSEPNTNTTSSSSGNASSSGNTSSSSGDGGAGGGGGTKMPNLGTQIDRMGRPAINTAANKTFEPNAMTADMGKDGWNANSDPATWSMYIPEVQANLAILDSLDTVCGNQLAADMSKNDPSRYATLAGVLVDDRLYVNLAGAACNTYLGVEANALGVANSDCGGRTLVYDVIDASYTALATGKLDGSVGDKINITPAAQGTTFPYLIDPY